MKLKLPIKPNREPDFKAGSQQFFIHEMVAFNEVSQSVHAIKIKEDGSIWQQAYTAMPADENNFRRYYNPEVQAKFNLFMIELEKILLGQDES